MQEHIPSPEEYQEHQRRAAIAFRMRSVAELRAMSDAEIVQMHDDLAVDGSFVLTPDDYLDELSRRSVERSTNESAKVAEAVKKWTVFMAVLAIMNTVLVALQLWLATR